MGYEEELDNLIKRTKTNDTSPSYTASYETIDRALSYMQALQDMQQNE